jgi:type IV pilus assembly protein PilV
LEFNKGKYTDKDQQGFSIMEVLISLVVFSIGALGITAMQINAIRGNSDAHYLTEASSCMAGVSEKIMVLPYDDVESGTMEAIGSALPEKYTLSSTIIEDDIDLDGTGDVKRIEVTIEWNLRRKRMITFNIVKQKN